LKLIGNENSMKNLVIWKWNGYV